MARKRLGTLSGGSDAQPMEVPPNPEAQPALVITYRGPGESIFSEFDFDEFRDEPLIWLNRDKLAQKQIVNKSQGTLDALRRDLRTIKAFLSWLRKDQTMGFRHLDELSFNQHSRYIQFAKNSPNPHVAIRTYRRIMKALGAEPSLLPPNPYPPRKPQPKPSVDPSVAKSVLNEAKRQAAVINRRVTTLDRILTSKTHLARLIELVGDPDFIIRFIRASKSERRRLVYTLAGIEGPEYIELNNRAIPGSSRRSVSWSTEKSTGHVGLLRWVYPSVTDLFPYFAMMLIRTPVNPTPLSEAHAEAEPFAPFPLNVTSKPNQEFLYFFASKLRGRNEELDEPYIQPCITPKIGYSYPYQIFHFVKKLTEPVRIAIIELINRLRSEGHTIDNSKELRHLDMIKNDLFVYRSQSNGFKSYRTAVSESSPHLKQAFKAIGLNESRSIFRKLQLRFGYDYSGNSLLEAQLHANHRDPRTTARYTRHANNIKKKLMLFEDIFEHSMILIEAGTYDADSIRLLLESQGLDGDQIDNLLSYENETRWGNRCSSPRNPPKGFDVGTPPGEVCRRQNCIDGCPNARWFADSRPRVAAARERLVVRLGSLPASGTNESSLQTRIELCNRVLAALEVVGF